MQIAIQELGAERVMALVKQYASYYHVPEHTHIDYVCRACCENVDLAPKNRGKRLFPVELNVRTWVERFLIGYKNRISERASKTPSTTPDPVIDLIIATGIPTLREAEVERIKFAHRLSMSAENILGILIEEYIFEKLHDHGWALGWGETIKAVDLCSEDGKLIQIKSRDNTENSSSSKIRTGTQIEKWFRTKSSTGETKWNDLCLMTQMPVGYMTEHDFREYVKLVVTQNPKALAVDDDSPWRSYGLPI